MIKLLIGGSPCTYWSIAQKTGRETKAEGLGWELFRNYLIAKEKYKPDFFLYENNKSASKDIKQQIKTELCVTDDGESNLLSVGTGARYIEINSALVSAQNRQRFYVHNCGDVKQPEDRGILLRDILETGSAVGDTDEKAFALTSSYWKGHPPERTISRHQRTLVAEPINTTDGGKSQTIKAQYSKSSLVNFCCYTSTYGATGVAEPVNITEDGKSQVLKANYYKSSVANFFNGEGGMKFAATGVSEPVRVGTFPSEEGTVRDSQATRIYGVDGKSICIIGHGGGQGVKTGLYAVPYLSDGEVDYMFRKQGRTEYGYIQNADNEKAKCVTANISKGVPYNVMFEKTGKDTSVPVYEVKAGQITIKGKQYPIKLQDGFYIIRKLTVNECCRLQTLPDGYCDSVSATQGYKGLGNGWTAEVIIHILSEALKDVPKDEPIEVLSMYDGIGTGRYCLDKMGFTNVTYYAYEIDKYAIKVATTNYPDIIECGDAFQVREDDWELPRKGGD